MANTLTFQNNTAYNAGDLNGNAYSTRNTLALVFWFTNSDTYDGTATLQICPDYEAAIPVWYALDFYDTNAITTVIHSLSAPTSTKAYVAGVPGNVLVRIQMSGGANGHLSAYGLLTSFIPA